MEANPAGSTRASEPLGRNRCEPESCVGRRRGLYLDRMGWYRLGGAHNSCRRIRPIPGLLARAGTSTNPRPRTMARTNHLDWSRTDHLHGSNALIQAVVDHAASFRANAERELTTKSREPPVLDPAIGAKPCTTRSQATSSSKTNGSPVTCSTRRFTSSFDEERPRRGASGEGRSARRSLVWGGPSLTLIWPAVPT